MTYALLVFILIREALHWYERKKLLEMVMAKSLPELKQVEAKPSKPTLPTAPDLIPVEVASDKAFDAAIRRENGRETLKERVTRKMRSKNG